MASILIIDDEESLRSTLQMVLHEAGYTVLTAGNGEDALHAVSKVKLDLVLTDVLMPKRDGIEVVSALRKTNPTLPVVVMTGGGHLPASYYLKLARDLGAKGILQKPFSHEQLLATIGLALMGPEHGA